MKARAFHVIAWAAFLFLLAGLPRLKPNTDFLQLLPRSDAEVARFLAEGKAEGYHIGYVVAVPLREERFGPGAFDWSRRAAGRLRALPRIDHVSWIGDCGGDCGRMERAMRADDNLAVAEALSAARDRDDSLRLFLSDDYDRHPAREPVVEP